MNSREASGVSTALSSSLSPSPIKGTKINRCSFCRKRGRATEGGEKKKRKDLFTVWRQFLSANYPTF